jgi:hypothetical protein
MGGGGGVIIGIGKGTPYICGICGWGADCALAPPCKWWTKMVDDPSGFGMAVVALISDTIY